MPTISKSDFARLCGVKPPSITQAIAARRVVVDAEGSIDPALPLNRAYLDSHRGGPKPAKTAALPSSEEAAFQAAARKRQAKRDTAPPPPPSDPDDAEDPDGDPENAIQIMASHEIEKKRLTKARRELAERDTAVRDLRIAKEKGALILRDIERRKWSQFDAALKTHLRDLPRRTAARLHAIAIAEGPRALESALESEISAALARVVEAAKESGLA